MVRRSSLTVLPMATWFLIYRNNQTVYPKLPIILPTLSGFCLFIWRKPVSVFPNMQNIHTMPTPTGFLLEYLTDIVAFSEYDYRFHAMMVRKVFRPFPPFELQHCHLSADPLDHMRVTCQDVINCSWIGMA